MASIPDIFGGPLERDPAVALKPFPVTTVSPAPIHKVQYVVEVVGPRTMAAQSAKVCLETRWKNALGDPEIYVMAAVDERWRPLVAGDPAGAYDSLAFAWDFVTDRGSLSCAAAQDLLNVAEQFAKPLSRRAMALPPPADVDPVVAAIKDAAEHLDIGVGLTIAPRYEALPEKSVWVECAALGLQGDSKGLFEWTVPGWEEPLLTLSSLGDKESFSLQAVMNGATHPGLSLGFRVARSPNPVQVLDACLRIAEHFERKLGTITLDDTDQPLDAAGRQRLIGLLSQALSTFTAVGLTPGSPAALKVFR